MKVAFITTDNREHWQRYDELEPLLPPAQGTLLLSGFPCCQDEVEIHVVSCTKRPMESPERLGPNVLYHSVVVPPMGWGRTLFAGCVRAVRKKLREIKPDLVHGQGTERECAMVATHSGYRNVLTIHGNVAELYRRSLYGGTGLLRLYGRLAASLETHALGRTAGVFCNSRHTREIVRARTRRCWEVPNALGQEFFAPLPDRTHPVSRPVTLLNVATINDNKRQVEVLHELTRLRATGVEMNMLFVGYPCDRPDWLEVFQPAEAAGWARHLGYLGVVEIRDLMDRCDALVHFPQEEAFGLVVAEALARNMKLFASNVGGIRDIATGVRDCVLHDDLGSLVADIEDWIGQGAIQPTESAPLMRERYAPEVVARRHVEIYREVLREMSSPSEVS